MSNTRQTVDQGAGGNCNSLNAREPSSEKKAWRLATPVAQRTMDDKNSNQNGHIFAMMIMAEGDYANKQGKGGSKRGKGGGRKDRLFCCSNMLATGS